MFDWTTIAIVLPTLVVAYIIFGIAGFGTALVAAPVLAHAMPIASVVPLLALLDFAAAAVNGFQLSDKIAKDELFWLAPLMIAGSIIGVTLLISLPATLMMFLLGVFAAGYGIHSLFARAAYNTRSGKDGSAFSVRSAGSSARCSGAAALCTRSI